MGDLEHALSAYENALRHNAYSIPGLTQVAGIARIKENFQMVRRPAPDKIGLSYLCRAGNRRPRQLRLLRPFLTLNPAGCRLLPARHPD